MDYTNLLNKTVLSMRPSGIRKFFDIVASMPEAISLGVGEPDFVTPWDFRAAAIGSIQKGYTAYTSNQGLIELRTEVCEYLASRFGVNYCPTSEALITVGASEAIDLSLRATINLGDEVLIPDPSYVSYAPNVLLVGGVPVGLKTVSKDSFKLTPEVLEKAITKKTKLLILPFPNNPTGAVMTKADLEKLVPIIKKYNLLVLSDEIYAELTYEGSHTSIASLKNMRERTILVSGFSKAFAMTGWRLGYACAPYEILGAMSKIHQYTIMCAPTASQYAALEALRTGKKDNYSAVNSMKDSYNMRRRFLVDAFNRIGLNCFEPHGAFYAFPSVKNTNLNGEDFAEKLLLAHKVAVVPGSAFGDSGKNYVRACYASSMENLTKAVERIALFIE